MIKVLTTALALSLFTLPANAARRVCGDIEGYPVCAIDDVDMDTLTIAWDDGDQTAITVHCPSGVWHRTGWSLNETEINKIVNSWCY